MTPTLDRALAAAATLVAAAFTLATWERWRLRRRPQELAWSVSLAWFTVGAGALWWGFARGWSTASFRTFYLAGAIVNVPWLALGTVYLQWGARIGDRVRTALIALTGLACGVMAEAPFRAVVPRDTLPEGRAVFGVWPRALAAVGSGVAAIVIFVGAVWSVVGFVRRRSAPAHRVVGTVLIALGTAILSGSGALAGRVGADRAFVLTLLVGVVVLFAGFLSANGAPPRPQLAVILEAPHRIARDAAPGPSTDASAGSSTDSSTGPLTQSSQTTT
ncbi:MAG: hypothetical protein R2705_07405 [Ilumatobacteraceae bacterium]